MNDDSDTFTTESSPGEQAFESTVDDAEKVRLAQSIESHNHESANDTDHVAEMLLDLPVSGRHQRHREQAGGTIHD